MKKILIVLTIILSLVFLKVGYTYLVNEIIINDYNNNKYDNNLMNTLYLLNFQEPYIAYYNHGNILYRIERYDEAITKYEESLTKNPQEERICDIRVNLSLSYIKTISVDNKDEALNILDKALNNLYEDDCASKIDDDGESKQAEKLEEEIKQLQKQIEEGQGSDDPGNNNPGEEPETPNNANNIEEQIRELQRQNQQNRQRDLDYYSQLDNGSFYYGQYW